MPDNITYSLQTMKTNKKLDSPNKKFLVEEIVTLYK